MSKSGFKHLLSATINKNLIEKIYDFTLNWLGLKISAYNIMTLINLNLKSIHNPNITIKILLLEQLKKLQPNSITVELFKYNSSPLDNILPTNIYLLNIIEKKQ